MVTVWVRKFARLLGAIAARRRSAAPRPHDSAYAGRLAVARQVEDLVGHNLATIDMQAAVALHMLDQRPEQTRIALEAIKSTSARAIDELRAVVAVFRDAGRSAPAGKQVSAVGRLDALVELMAENGLAVEVRVDGEIAPMAASVDLCCYSVLAGALARMLRLNQISAATVHIVHSKRELTLDIRDRDGTSRTVLRADAAAVRELGVLPDRVAGLGGILEVASLDGAGFHVRARLPKEGAVHDPGGSG